MISSARTSFIAAFAEELRRARVYNRVELSDVAEQTHLAVEFLEALEQGRWEAIPAPYVRGYLYLYAQAVGMNVEKVLKSYDDLVRARADEESAELDSSSPLLRQPERVGVTRAKIRAAWFTAITQNRKTAYLAMLIATAVLVSGLYLSRRTQRFQVRPASFTETVAEYGSLSHGPITRLDLSVSDSLLTTGSHPSRDATLIATDTGHVTFSGNVGPEQRMAFYPFDTLLIQYNSDTYVSVRPQDAVLLIGSKGDTLVPTRTGNDIAFYALTERKERTIFAVVDSLSAP